MTFRPYANNRSTRAQKRPWSHRCSGCPAERHLVDARASGLLALAAADRETALDGTAEPRRTELTLTSVGASSGASRYHRAPEIASGVRNTLAGMPRDTDALAAIDAKLTALLALAMAAHSGDLPGQRSPDRLLVDSGLSTAQAAKILGKTERAVQLVLQKERLRKRGGGTT